MRPPICLVARGGKSRAINKRAAKHPAEVMWVKASQVEGARLRRRSPDLAEEPRSTVLSVEEEAIVIAFRRHTLLPLDHCSLFASNDIPHLTRSSLHRCLQRHGISRLPEVEGDKPEKKRFYCLRFRTNVETCRQNDADGTAQSRSHSFRWL